MDQTISCVCGEPYLVIHNYKDRAKTAKVSFTPHSTGKTQKFIAVSHTLKVQCRRCGEIRLFVPPVLLE